MDNDVFRINGEDDLSLLAEWLKLRTYNRMTYPHRDQKGYPFVGLAYAPEDSDRKSEWDRRGIVLARNDALYARVLGVVQANIGA